MEALLVGGGGTGCPTGTKQYTATRFEYAKNGETVTYVLGEQWCWDSVTTTQSCTQPPLSDPTNSYKVLWARELGACHKSG